MQKHQQIYDYINEYQRLVYDYYSKVGISFIVTYYNVNPTSTIWEDENLFGGAYEKIGDMSGIKWNKYLLIPVYFIDEMGTVFDGQDIGYIKEGETNIVIPSSYGILPYPHDKIKFEQTYLRPTNDIYPIYTVTGVEKTTNLDRSFFKLKIEVEQSITTTQLDLQVENNYTFYNYDKKIHSIEEAEFLTKMLIKNKTIKDNLSSLYNENTGFYLI